MEVHEKVNEKVPTCRVCQQKFTTFQDLKKHIRLESHHDVTLSKPISEGEWSGQNQTFKPFPPSQSYDTFSQEYALRQKLLQGKMLIY
jgi:hypothetical protein